MNERESFIRETAARCLPTIIKLDGLSQDYGHIEAGAGWAAQYATALADALGIPATTTPSDCYEIDKAAVDGWFSIFDGVAPIPENERRLYLAILAQRKESK